MHDELDDLLRRSLDAHAAAGGEPTATLDPVWRRVEHRARRRRAVAIGGSLAVIAAGVVGIAALGGRRPAPSASAPDPSASETTAPNDTVLITTTSMFPGDMLATAWACNGAPLLVDGGISYYEDFQCYLVPRDQVGVPTVPPPTMTVPPTTGLAPSTAGYIVVEGDSVYSIAAAAGMTPENLAAFNGWPDGVRHALTVGEQVLIPVPEVPTTAPTANDTAPPPTITTTSLTLAGDGLCAVTPTTAPGLDVCE